MNGTVLRCDVGGDYWYPSIPGPAVYRDPCPNPPIYRWRTEDLAPGHWNYRCGQHASWLSMPNLVLEPLS